MKRSNGRQGIADIGSVAGNGRNGTKLRIPVIKSRHAAGNLLAEETGSSGREEAFAEQAHELEALRATVAAIGKSQAVIEFQMDGTILTANQNFLDTVGYSLDEIKGRHHRMFVEAAHQSSSDYADFWARLNRGEYQAAEYKRIGKGGREVWIQASYNPIVDEYGKPAKVIKYATDITAQILMREKMTRMLASVWDVSVSIAASAEQLTGVSQHLTTHASETAEQANAVSRTSTQVSSNVNMVAASSEEMMVSIREISKSATEAARVAKSAVTIAENTNRTIQQLGTSSSEIGKVIKVITSIAQQTNLLALNATIELRAPGKQARALPWLPTRSRSWQRRPRGRPKRSVRRSRPFNRTPVPPSRPSAKSRTSSRR